MVKKNENDFNVRLSSLRRQAMLTQKQVADALGINRSTYAYYELKDNPSTPSIGILKKLAALYTVPLQELTGDDTPSEGGVLYFAASEPDFNSPTILESFNELSNEEKSLILRFRSCSDEEKSKIDSILSNK